MTYFWMILTIISLVLAFGMYEETGDKSCGYYIIVMGSIGIAFGFMSELRMKYYKEYIQRKYNIEE